MSARPLRLGLRLRHLVLVHLIVLLLEVLVVVLILVLIGGVLLGRLGEVDDLAARATAHDVV